MSTSIQRRLPVGAEVSSTGVHFRVWAPRCKHVEVVIDNTRVVTLQPESEGYFSALDESSGHGTLYQFRLDGAQRLLPDPASRYQPAGPHGPSEVIDPAAFQWTQPDWPGIRIEGQVLYEMHIGTFTREGTWQAAQVHLPEIRDTGITVLELMPIASFPGSFGWGYDGVNLFAPAALYGSPEDMCAFVDRAHSLGLGVILDVVYNHFGPDGNYLKEFSEAYFTNRYANEWGEAINFDGPDSSQVREFFISNAVYWIQEFRLDGLRLDATQQIFDCSRENIIMQITRESRDAAQGRDIIVIAENEPQDSILSRSPERGGYGLDAQWNDDFHHTATVAMTGQCEAYYSDYQGTPQEFISAIRCGFLFQGQYHHWQKQRRGTPSLDLKPAAFVVYLQNHDQVANSATSERIHKLTSPGRLKALTALMLLGPNTPLLFQGQEFGASSPFYYFADHHGELAALVQRGRIEFLSQFPGLCQANASIPDVNERSTFEASRLVHSERDRHPQTVALHRDLIRLRREDAVFRAQRSDWISGAVLGSHAFVLRFFGGELGDRLIVVNLGRDLRLRPVPEPLLAPPPNLDWQVIWSSEGRIYSGSGRTPLDDNGIWSLMAESTVVLTSGPCPNDPAPKPNSKSLE